MTYLEAKLRAIKVLLKEPKNWTKRVAARDAKNHRVVSTSAHAVCWCLTGAANRVCAITDVEHYVQLTPEVESIFLTLAEQIPMEVEYNRNQASRIKLTVGEQLAHFNDYIANFASMHALIDRAIVKESTS